MTTSTSLYETVEQLRASLRDYIEATYHISNAALVRARRRCLDADGVISQSAYLESTPRYQAGRPYSELALTDTARQFLTGLGQPAGDAETLLHDPPYSHQAEALEAIARGRSLLVMTGTGSGKTETFLLPILASLAEEASSEPTSFALPGVRALLLYPMNALVNDQLGRLRLLLGNTRVRDSFINWAGRPARFARYTSRTLYPGVRSAERDKIRLKSIDDTYLTWMRAAQNDTPAGKAAEALVSELKVRGKWPSKPDLEAWYGKGKHWQAQDGSFARAIPMPGDAELFTRHEVLLSPPDLLVTNYSMLEYTLMRPLERNIYDATSRWLHGHPERKFLLVIDEAHLYRGTGGAEVGLLIRRLRARLGIRADRLQVICTSASFSDPEVARSFAAQLTGKHSDDFDVITGKLDARTPAAPAHRADADALAALDLAIFFDAETDQNRRGVVEPLIERLDLPRSSREQGLSAMLHSALRDYPPLNLAVNLTMETALTLDELGEAVFPDAPPAIQDHALTALLTLGSLAREHDDSAGLLPCRVHSFFRGLPGLWVCLDPECPKLPPEASGVSPCGAMYSQPRSICDCGARALEFFTCRHCGTAYGRAYTDNLEEPRFLWSEPGDARLSFGWEGDLKPIDLLLEGMDDAFENGAAVPADLDLTTGRLSPGELMDRVRTVGLRVNRSSAPVDPEDDDEAGSTASGEFIPCGVCGKRAGYGRSSVQNHQTKGDEPFQALVRTQLLVQPPAAKEATDFAPLRGRKVLTFADSRQTAARLAPRLQSFSMRDVLRPVLLRGWKELEASPLGSTMSLEHLALAACVGAVGLGVRLRPEVKEGESFRLGDLRDLLAHESLEDPATFTDALTLAQQPPRALVEDIARVVGDAFYGLEALGLASVMEAERRKIGAAIDACPDIPGLAVDAAGKRAVVRVWLNRWAVQNGWAYASTSDLDIGTERGPEASKTGLFRGLRAFFAATDPEGLFKKHWLPILLPVFTREYADKRVLSAGTVTLGLKGTWGYCERCRSTQRPLGESMLCASCGNRSLRTIDPEADDVFLARKRYYRKPVLDALKEHATPPITIIAAEHTAQLNAPKSETVFSKAEQHELLFQDIDLSGVEAASTDKPAIDVLSCTTTMEVGIDIGALSGVAMRNMPPSRANYQQRAGRAGRRGNAIATVVAFAGSDTHDEHYFTNARDMIRGRVIDPTLTLDNQQILERHVLAYLLQRYHLDRLDTDHLTSTNHQLFAVLGTVEGFLGADPTLNIQGFTRWLAESRDALHFEIADWLPDAISELSRNEVLDHFPERALDALNSALVRELSESPDAPTPSSEDVDLDEQPEELQDETKSAKGTSRNVLDQLMYHGVLPKYAFPTDVVSFHVFESQPKTHRIEDRYAPSQGLAVALSQYAPGKDVWIDNKLWTSGAIYGSMPNERREAWQNRTRYFECPRCHYGTHEPVATAERREIRACPACHHDQFGPARDWMRPPGFAHPYGDPERVINEAPPLTSYATRAQLMAAGPSEAKEWEPVSQRIRTHQGRQALLVTNTGPNREGYAYCTNCGRIEPMASFDGRLRRSHTKPYPSRNPECPSTIPAQGLVLGTEFVSDVLLVGFRAEAPVQLSPGELATDVALRTCAEALSLAATRLLEIEASELQAEYRPALTPDRQHNWNAEIYLYDTLAGGAGFANIAAHLGVELFERALQILQSCPDDCDQSCYRCLRNFGNRFEHRLLDRHVGASLLQYLLGQGAGALDAGRLEAATERLFEDLRRLGREFQVSRNVALQVPGESDVIAPIYIETPSGVGLVAAVSSPLTPGAAPDPRLRLVERMGTRLVLADEVRVTHNLPAATEHVLRSGRLMG